MAGSLLVLDSTANSATMRSLRNNYHCVLIVSLSVGRQIFRAISFVWSIIAKPPSFRGHFVLLSASRTNRISSLKKGVFLVKIWSTVEALQIHFC